MEQPTKLVYVAGCYRSKHLWGVVRNIFVAWRAAKQLWLHNIAAVCPHANTIWMSEPPNSIPGEIFLAGDLLMVERCDAILMLPHWYDSVGARGEYIHALAMHVPVFFSMEDVIQWAKNSPLPSAKNFLRP